MTTTELEPSFHAVLSASSSERWMNCPGSVNLSRGLSSSTSFYAAQGTYAHHIAAECLEHGKEPSHYIGLAATSDGFDIECDDDMAEAVEVYVKHVRETMAKGDKLHVEVSLHEALRGLDPEFGGTADCVIYKPASKTLIVMDYKHGSGKYVEVEGNTQLKYYAVGAMLAFKVPVERVEVHIVQPRCNTAEAIRTVVYDAIEMLDFVADIEAAAAATRAEDAKIVAGEWCMWCPAKRRCPLLEEKQALMVADDFDVLTIPDLTPQQVADALDIFPLVEERIKAIREYAYELGMKGEPPPGHKIVEKRATRKYKDEEAAKARLVAELGEKALTEPKLKSPAQIEKVLPKGRKVLLDDLVEKVSSGYVLVAEDDKRPPALIHVAEDNDFDSLT